VVAAEGVEGLELGRLVGKSFALKGKGAERGGEGGRCANFVVQEDAEMTIPDPLVWKL
jgi:hypothetical protein